MMSNLSHSRKERREIFIRQTSLQFNPSPPPLSGVTTGKVQSFFLFIHSVCMQPVLHHSAYHGIFTVLFFLLCYVTNSILACSLGVVTESGHFSIVPVACGICFRLVWRLRPCLCGIALLGGGGVSETPLVFLWRIGYSLS
jgi:hypothetical protein